MEPPALELRHVSKAYPGVRALSGVSLTVSPGEVHALVGENGAGKSTLIKIATGAVAPDGGTIGVAGKVVAHPNRPSMEALGVRAVYQELHLAPDLSVAENVLLSSLPRRCGVVRWPEARREATARLARLGIEVDPTTPVRALPASLQQLVEIARVVTAEARVVVFDEPTAALHRSEAERLFAVIRSLCAAGVGVLYISHHLSEVLELADRVTVLRDGTAVASRPAADLDIDSLTALMFGRAIAPAAAGPADRSTSTGDPILVGRDLHVGRRLRGVTIAVRPGEVVACCGGTGSGLAELARALAGAARPSRGVVTVRGVRVRNRRQAAGRVAYLPPDRKRAGLMLDRSVAENLLLGPLATKAPAVVTQRWLRGWAAEQARRATVQMTSVAVPVRTLSGGNQQKVVLGRWLAVGADVLVVDEPTIGVDAAAKLEIYTLLRSLAAAGAAVVVCTTDFSEVRQVADRVLVLRDGRVVAELPGAAATEPALMAAENAA